MSEVLNLVQEWDKAFFKSEKINHNGYFEVRVECISNK